MLKGVYQWASQIQWEYAYDGYNCYFSLSQHISRAIIYIMGNTRPPVCTINDQELNADSYLLIGEQSTTQLREHGVIELDFDTATSTTAVSSLWFDSLWKMGGNVQ